MLKKLLNLLLLLSLSVGAISAFANEDEMGDSEETTVVGGDEEVTVEGDE